MSLHSHQASDHFVQSAAPFFGAFSGRGKDKIRTKYYIRKKMYLKEKKKANVKTINEKQYAFFAYIQRHSIKKKKKNKARKKKHEVKENIINPCDDSHFRNKISFPNYFLGEKT